MPSRLPHLLLLLGLALGACGPRPMPVTLPDDATGGLLDPGRRAILNTAYDLGVAGQLEGAPAEAALALAQAEFLAVDLVTNQRWTEFSPLVSLSFIGARDEWRAALGIAPEAAPQAVIDALMAARRGLRNADPGRARASLQPPIFTAGGAATLDRLAALPPLPRTGQAAAAAERELMRMQSSGDGDRRF